MNNLARMADHLGACTDDPDLYVRTMFPWGAPGTILKDHTGPDAWQTQVMQHISRQLSRNEPVRIAVASGHGIGKSAEMAWLIKWFMSTRGPNPQIVVTANTKNQLMTKTWRELARWNELSRDKELFTWTATRFYGNAVPSTWAANAIPWSKERSEAFAGTHEEHVMLLYDEASAIDDSIWEVSEGAMTTPGAIWIAFGNPTRNTGRFRECFPGGEFSHRWFTLNIDSRDAKMADRRQLDEWIEDYGIDSDFCKVRILGQFPSVANAQFISTSDVERAMRNRLRVEDYDADPKILTCDVARFGDDQTVIGRRQGNKVWPLDKHRGLDTMAVARKVAEHAENFEADAIFVDGVGIGAGVVDRLRQLNLKVFDVQAGSKPDDQESYFNKRAEMWGNMKKWLQGDAELPDDDAFKKDLIGIEYGFSGKGQIQLEKKSDMKKRGLQSPDCGDCLALGFAEPVRHKAIQTDFLGLRASRPTPSWRVA